MLAAIGGTRRAMAAFCVHPLAQDDAIEISALAEVNAMLIADKVQNRKDFEIHHAATHPNRAVLARYFRNGLRRLGVPEPRYAELAEVCRLAQPAQ